MRPCSLAILRHLPALARGTDSRAAHRYRRKRAVATVAAPRKKKRQRRRDGVRVFRMASLYRSARQFGSQETKVPYLRMSGRWLKECGFEIGARVYLTVENGRLIVTNLDPALAAAPPS
jgi:Toxin SymE, type I toxin-antitoxin system